jgi:hypothetical protein
VPVDSTPTPATASSRRPAARTPVLHTGWRRFESCRDDSVLSVRRCYGRHASVVGRRFGFESRADLWFEIEGCWSNSKTPALHAGDRGATPRRSTDDRRAHGPTGRRRLREAEIRVRLPAGPLRAVEAWGHGPTGGHRPGVAEVRVRLPVTPLKFVGRQANWRATPLLAGRPSTGLWVRVPRLPLHRPDGETEITPRS